jgi:hypothetical protein
MAFLGSRCGVKVREGMGRREEEKLTRRGRGRVFRLSSFVRAGENDARVCGASVSSYVLFQWISFPANATSDFHSAQSRQ